MGASLLRSSSSVASSNSSTARSSNPSTPTSPNPVRSFRIDLGSQHFDEPFCCSQTSNRVDDNFELHRRGIHHDQDSNCNSSHVQEQRRRDRGKPASHCCASECPSRG